MLTRRRIARAMSVLVALAAAPAFAQAQQPASGVQITRAGSQAPSKGPAQYFTGAVRIDPLFQTSAPSRAGAGSVTFEPGARTVWHSHPLGQTLIVTTGVGWVQSEGDAKQEMRPGDVVWVPPGVKHWHGATATSAMTHIAVNEMLDGTNVIWMEPVPDDQYQK